MCFAISRLHVVMEMDMKNTDVQVNEVVEVEKLPKRRSISLTAGEGAKAQRLTVLAQRRPNGSATVVVTVLDVKSKKNSRGMTQNFDTFDAAVAALTTLVQDAQKKGWKKSERAGGFKPRADAFSTMPVAPKAGGAK